MVDFTKLKALKAAVKETGKDLTKAQAGGDFQPPAKGATRLRFVGYTEIGIHTTEWQGTKKQKSRAVFTFELSGPKHEPKKLDDGRIIPQTITFREPIGYTAKNGYFKLFKLMSADFPGATSFIELVGEGFRGTVEHREFTKRDGSKGLVASLKTDSGYTIRGTKYEDPESGELRQVKVDEPLSPIKVFLWDYADTEQWDSLFVDGQWDDGESKNKLQNEIRKAENFAGSPIYEALIEAGREAETVAPTPQSGADAGGDEAEGGDDTQEGPAEAPSEPVVPAKSAAKGKVAPTPAKAATVVPAKPKAPVKPAAKKVDGDPLAGL